MLFFTKLEELSVNEILQKYSILIHFLNSWQTYLIDLICFFVEFSALAFDKAMFSHFT